jgi:aspartate racemase
VVNPDSKARYLGVIDTLLARGAKGVIAGCTEIELLIGQGDLQVPLFPTAYLHAVAAVDFALAD